MFHANAVLDASHSFVVESSSASIALVSFFFLSILFFNIFADLINLFLSPSFLKFLNACVRDTRF